MLKKYFSFCLLIVILHSCYKESFIPIEGDIITSFVKDDESVPVEIHITNKIQGADTFLWEFEGGNPAVSNLADPGNILYTQPGTYTIKLTASNTDGEEKKIVKEIVIKDALNAKFTYAILKNNFSPVEVKLTNLTQGQGISYHWDFEGGNPATYDGQNPPNVVFTIPGEHLLKLTISNGFESQTIEGKITVAPLLECNFDWTVAVTDNDYQAPVQLNIINQSISATNYSWSLSDGTINDSASANPILNFTSAGSYTITLTATNGKETKNFSKTVTIYPDTNLYSYENVKLGINSAHQNNSYGAFYSTLANKVYSVNEVNNQNSGLIDIVFSGLNSSFTTNKFVSPSVVSNYGFLALTNAQSTIFVNSQELCNCGLSFTVNDFDAMINDNPIKNLIIVNTPSATQAFGSNLPRVILFKTQDGRKGAIKIKGMIQNGLSSYINCDIKVQKK
ncbi:PKD domain-containing protein [Flavobacterium oreochromis]|uniref:PKD domain-containing protein n=1 Tax=Flavobacterium oreochromis TaxID=2906078 RepID=UPI00385828C4